MGDVAQQFPDLTVKAASTAAVAADKSLVVSVSPNNSVIPDVTASGNITTQNLVPGGTATAGSAVAITLHSGQSVLGIQITGTYTGILSVQGTLDDTNWVTLTGGVIFAGTSFAASIASASVGLFSVNAAGYSQLRVTGLVAMTGTAVVTLRAATSSSSLAVSIGGPVIVSGAVNATPVYGLGSTVLGMDVGMQYRATSTGGATVAKIVSAASTNATNPKASAGRLLGWALTNTSAALKYVHIYNKTGVPTVGTDSPFFTIAVPASGSTTLQLPGGIAMATGIAYSITNLAADLDATAVALGDVIGSLFYA